MSHYLRFEDGKGKLDLTKAAAVRLGISFNQYERAKTDILQANSALEKQGIDKEKFRRLVKSPYLPVQTKMADSITEDGGLVLGGGLSIADGGGTLVDQTPVTQEIYVPDYVSSVDVYVYSNALLGMGSAIFWYGGQPYAETNVNTYGGGYYATINLPVSGIYYKATFSTASSMGGKYSYRFQTPADSIMVDSNH